MKNKKKEIKYWPEVDYAKQVHEIQEIISFWNPELLGVWVFFPYPSGLGIKVKPITSAKYFKENNSNHPETPELRGILKCYYCNGYRYTLGLAKEKKLQNWIPNMKKLIEEEEKDSISEEENSSLYLKTKPQEDISRDEIEKKKKIFQNLINEKK